MNIKKIIYFLVFAIFIPINAYQHDLAICAIFQNEAPYLKEWLEFNILIGVEHFYLYNNYSTDNYKEILEPYINAGIVECIDWPYTCKKDYAQIKAYNHCLNDVRGKVKWLMFIDIDEFLFPVQCDKLSEFLKDYEEFGAVCANWVMFGTSHVDKIPNNQLMTEVLTLTEASPNLHIKSIVQPHKVKIFCVHHVVKFYPPYFQVTTDKIKFQGPLSPSTVTDKLQINHYWTRDNDFLYKIKIPRRYALTEECDEKWVLLCASNMNQQENLTIQKYTDKLKKIIFN